MNKPLTSATQPMLALLVFLTILSGLYMSIDAGGIKSIFDFTMKNIEGEPVPLSKYKGSVILIVNVASECGYTPQYKDLQALYEQYRDKGLVILGFPANNFGGQEPGTDEEIKSFCERSYGVTFDIFSKISVKGADQHPLYRYITSDDRVGGEVKWNFQKYLVGRDGTLHRKFSSAVKPLSDEIVTAVEEALKEKAEG